MFFWFNQNGTQVVDYPIEQKEKAQNTILVGSYSTGSLLVILAYLFL